jgi:hypothetical protein
MSLDKLSEPVVDLVPDLARHYGLERGVGELEGEIEGPSVALVNDGWHFRPFRPFRFFRSHQPLSYFFNRLDRSGKTNPLHWLLCDVGQPLQAQRQVCAPAGLEHRMDLVHDDGTHGPEHVPAALGGEQEVERLWSSDQDVGRLPDHRRALRGWGVAGADSGSDSRGVQSHLLS